MTFVTDRRGRIPFAFLGAVLLLSSSLYAISLAPPPQTTPAADEVVTDAQVEARLALDAAIRDADRKAAAEPVLEPSNNGLGAILPPDETFRHAFEIRIAASARQALNRTNVTRDSLEATVSLPAIRDRQSAKEALENVSISPVGEDRYRVRIEGIQVTVLRHDRPIDRFRYNTTITTELPALELHDRTKRYESRLNADLIDQGLTRDLTARLFPIVWMRGYAQYGGAPIKNVLANRHIEVMANDALLAQQAAVFGTEDEAGRATTGVAAAEVAARDAFLGAEETVKSQLSTPQDVQDGAEATPNSPDVPLPSVVDTEQSVDANHTADTAYLSFVEGREGPSLLDIVDEVYRADVRVESHAISQGTDRSTVGSPPESATQFYTGTRTERWLDGGRWSDGHGSTLPRYGGRVIEETTTTHHWVGNGTFETTQVLDRTTYRVELEIDCRYRAPGIAPDRPDGRCPFGAVARERLKAAITDQMLSGSDLEARAVSAVKGRENSGWQRVDIEPPESVTERAVRRTADLRRAIRGVSVTLETRSVASSANPAAELAGEIRDDRARLLDTPARYGTTADRAVAASRVTYFDRVTDQLDSRTPMVQKAQNAFAEQLETHLIPSSAPERSSPTADTYVSSVEGGPAYLSVDPPDGSAPRLATRNVNLFTVPYGDAADAVVDRIGAVGKTSVSLRTAAQTLQVLERSGTGDERAIRALRRELADSVDVATDRYRSVLARSIGSRQADRIVRSAATEWPDVSARAMAVVDGQLARAIASDLPREMSATERDKLRVALRVAGTDIQSEAEVRVSQSLVETARTEATSGSSPLVEESAKAVGTKASKTVWKKATETEVGSLPAGLPLLPLPGYWYATANAWTVSVEGSYDRFAVRTRRAAPGSVPNGTVEYIREQKRVQVDIDNDGQPETLGFNRPVSLHARTGVVIVVPPGGTGVGDVDGQQFEESRGW